MIGIITAVGFVLAGGQSTRMGRDKALVPFAGRPLVEHALAILREAGLSASLAGGRAELAAFAPLVPDAQPALGPLSGICAALASTAARRAVFLPVDAPLLPASLLKCLLRHAELTESPITLASVNGFAQTFPAILDRSVAPLLDRELLSGHRGCFSAFQAAASALGQPITVLAVEYLVQAGQLSHPRSLPVSRWFLNLNREDDLGRAEIHARALIA
jgi:molybdopterin-guanine dinucleotide biosynthesis protein A